ncbi:MAG TPA: transporter substrate-binding domain-containing protein [Solirubrobacterales bacterium]
MIGLVLCVGAVGALLAACGSSNDSSSSTGASADSGSATTNEGSCVPKHPGLKTINSGTLTVASVSDLPYIEGEGEDISGIDGVILPALAKMECLKLNVEPMSGAATLPAVQTGRADIAAGGWYRTPERAEVVGQTVPIWYDFPVVATKEGKITKVDELEDMTVGLIQGSAYVKPLEEALGSDHVKVYQSEVAVWQDIAAGRLEATVAGEAGSTYQNEQAAAGFVINPITPTPNFEIAKAPGEANYPYKKGDTELGEALSADITALRKDGTVKKALVDNGLTNPRAFTGPNG